MTIPNPQQHPTEANAGPDQEVSADADGFGTVMLDGSATADPDGDNPLQYWWLHQGVLLAIGVTPTVLLPPGRYGLTLEVRDPVDNISTDEVQITVTGKPTFLRADSNDDGTVDLSDAINTLGVLFRGQGRMRCEDAADANDDGEVDISDAVFTLGFLFLGNPPEIPAPSPERGIDPTPDALDCASYGK